MSTMLRAPTGWGYAIIRRFHAPSAAVMVATQTLESELAAHGFTNVVSWTRGVDTELFTPRREPSLDLPKPVSVYVGRISVEKNIEEFLNLDMPGTKLVVGGGPQLERFVLSDTRATFMDENLSKAMEEALQVTDKQARKHAEKYSWNACTDQFLQNLVRAS